MAHDKLRQSPCFKEMHDRLESGTAPEKVADWAQTSGGCFQGQKRDTLIRALYRYKKTMVPSAAAVVKPCAVRLRAPWGLSGSRVFLSGSLRLGRASGSVMRHSREWRRRTRAHDRS